MKKCCLFMCSLLARVTKKNSFAAGLFCVHIICMLDQLRVDKIPKEYILKRYTRNACQSPTFDRRDYEQTAPDGSSMFCRSRLIAETAMDLANRGVKQDRGYNRALAGMRELIQEVNVINEEEEAEKIMDARG